MKKGRGKRLTARLLTAAMLLASVPAVSAETETGTAEAPQTEVQAAGYIDTTFGYTLKGDPNYITDEAFFGKWDATQEKWTVSPKLNYADYPNLAPVERAVKNGDYEDAELMYYNYYVTKEASLNRKKDISTTVKDTITADLLQENYMYNGNSGLTPVAVMSFADKDEYVSADITDIVQSKFTSTTELAFYITATNKDGGLAKIYSADADAEDSTPYLQVKVNGTDLTIYPSADTYVSAGSNKTKNYGTEPWLEAEESAIGTKDLVDADTKRIYIRFNIGALKEGDTVTAATLNLRGFNGAALGTGDVTLTDADTEAGIATVQEKINKAIAGAKAKKVVVIQNGDSAWDETTLTYANATAQLIYSYDQDDTWQWNQPSGAGSRYQEELLRFNTWYDKLVKLYNATGDEAYAYTALRQLMDFITVSTAPGKTKPWLKTLDVAVRTQCMPGLTLQLLNSEHMTPDIFLGFMKYMWDQANDAKSFNTSGNWGSSETLGLYTVAANFPEFADSQAWISRVKARYDTICGKIMLADKTCTELSLGYTDYALYSTIEAKNLADSLGLEEYPFTEVTLEAIQGLGQYMMYAAMPGFSDHQEGDGYSHRGNYLTRLLTIGRWFDDQHLLFAGTEGTEGYEPNFKSILFPVGKKIAMRTGWDNNANYLYTSTDGGVGSHAHPDDLNIIVKAYGQYLLVDPLYGTYSSDSRATWLKSTKAHNVVCVNGTNQTIGSVRGSVDRWETNNAYDFVTESTTNDKNANYSRSILFVKPGFWLVNDYLTPKKSATNTYVQNWHFLPEANISMEETTKTVRTGFEGVNIQVIPIASERFDAAAIEDGYYSEGQNSFSEAKYADYTVKTDGTAVFNTILLPENVGTRYDVDTEEIAIDGLNAEDASAYAFSVQEQSTGETAKYQYFQLHNANKKGTYTVGDFTTDAAMLFAETDEDGNVVSVIAQDVKNIRAETADVTLLRSDETLDEISLKWSVGNIMLDGEGLTAETLKNKNVTIYGNGNQIAGIRLNQTDMTAQQKGGYVYFGTEPSITPEPGASATPTPTVTPRPTQNSGSHGMQSGGGGGGGTTVVATPTPAATPTPTAQPQETAPVMPEKMAAETEGHWAKTEISALYEAGVIKGNGESLNLSANVTRGEFLAMIVRALGLEQVPYQNSFADVSAEQWYADILETAKANALLQGDDGGRANADAWITREETAVILARAANLVQSAPQDAAQTAFSDETDIAVWAKDAVAAANRLGLLSGYPDGTFAPRRHTERAEAIAVIYRLMQFGIR